MDYFQDIIKQIKKDIKIYQFNEKENRFIVDNKCDKQMHSTVFNDIRKIVKLLTEHEINYIINEKDLSIEIHLLSSGDNTYLSKDTKC